MKTSIAICSAGLLLAAVLIVWQARALSRRDLVCRFCGKQLRRRGTGCCSVSMSGTNGGCSARPADEKHGLPHERGENNGLSEELQGAQRPGAARNSLAAAAWADGGGDIAAHFDLSGATVSHHLAILRDAGLVLDDRQGKYIYYELNMSVVDEILEWVSALRGEDRDEKNE